METTKRRSRWKNGTGKRLTFGEAHLNICRLLSPVAARHPWSYQYLPSGYIATLAGLSPLAINETLAKMRRAPTYIELPDQPRNNYRPLIYKLAKAGADELREIGVAIPAMRHHQLPHELLACIIAASFEYGARRHNLPIELGYRNQTSIHPDWPIFKLNGDWIWIEADMGTETLNSHTPEATSIGDKLETYLRFMAEGTIFKSRILFVTTRKIRRDSMIELLKRIIDKNGYPHKIARYFCFGTIKYDRYLNSIPPLTAAAISQGWMRAGALEPFNFLTTKE